LSGSLSSFVLQIWFCCPNSRLLFFVSSDAIFVLQIWFCYLKSRHLFLSPLSDAVVFVSATFFFCKWKNWCSNSVAEPPQLRGQKLKTIASV
jgi:hypothetical protein